MCSLGLGGNCWEMLWVGWKNGCFLPFLPVQSVLQELGTCCRLIWLKKKAKHQRTFKPVNFSWFFTSLSVQNFWFCSIWKCVKVKKPHWKLSVVLADVLDQRVYFCLSGSLYYVFNNFLVKHNLMSFLYKIKVVQLFTLRFFLNKNFLKKQSFYKWYSTMNIQWQVQ